MDKRTLIIQALQTLIMQDMGTSCSVEEIAKVAGIGKGSIYYYFKSKDEILDALIESNYRTIIDRCAMVINESKYRAVQDMGLLFQTYYASSVACSIDKILHEPQHAHIHQKSLAMILLNLTPILSNIIEKGIQEGDFQCTYPKQFSECILSELCFVFDYGIFTWTSQELQVKLCAMAQLLERGLCAPKHSFDFLTQAMDVFKRGS